MSVDAFLANPSQLLERYPDGGPQMVSQIRDLAVANPAVLQALLNLVANATKSQKTSLGSGLGQAARIVVRTNPPYAARIQLAIAELKDQDVVLAFAAIAGDQPIGGVAGAGGAVGGQTNPLPGNASSTGGPQNIGSNGVPTGPFSYNSSVGGLSGPISESQ